jgi:hypothetical protein
MDVVWYYYTVVGGEVELIYRTHENNFAIWGLGWRIFQGTGSSIIGGIIAPPLLDTPQFALYSSLLFLCLFLLFVLWACWRAGHFDTVFAILICATVVVNPTAWSHYYILLILPLAVAGRYLHRLDLPKRETYWGVGILILLLWPRSQLEQLVRLFALNDTQFDVFPIVSFSASLLTLIPLLTVIMLLIYIWQLGRQQNHGSYAQQ